jgi:site-specific DNA recombinase
MPKTSPVVRCGIYTRKSTEEGLEQEFNSLHAQREAAEAYIKSQKHLGLVLLAEHYDDGGFTGSNLDRPALQRLLADIEARRVDCVVVYKVDRLSRSLLDFARLVDRFDQRSVRFVSVTQQFNTTTSLGRLTLNIPHEPTLHQRQRPGWEAPEFPTFQFHQTDQSPQPSLPYGVFESSKSSSSNDRTDQ